MNRRGLDLPACIRISTIACTLLVISCQQQAGGGRTGDSGPVIIDEGQEGCGAVPIVTAGADETPNYNALPTAIVPQAIRTSTGLPASVDLADQFPTPCHQGELNACVGWIGGYAMMTNLAAKNIPGWADEQADLNQTNRQFSPSFIFNQANAALLGKSRFDSCDQAGTFLPDMFVLVRDQGCATWEQMPYTPDDCESNPTADAIDQASDFRIAAFHAIETDVATLRSYLSEGVPVAAVFAVGEVFQQLTAGDIYDTNEGAQGLSHAMVAIGYDDAANDGDGAVKVMNSWGRNWGDSGFGMISYRIWPLIVQEAYIAPDLVTRITSVSSDTPDATTTGKSSLTHQDVDIDMLCARNPALDTDGDGYFDDIEILFGLDPNVPDPNPDFVFAVDTDGDNWPDETETIFGTALDDPTDFPFDCDYQYPDDFYAVGTVTGSVVNAQTGEPIAGALARISGTELEATTDELGMFTIENVLNGENTIFVIVDGFVANSRTQDIVADAVTEVSIGLVPIGAIVGDRIVAVLAWGESPRDLDLHMSGPISADNPDERFHAYFSNRTPVGHACLDLDDTDSFGPETMSVNPLADGTFVPGEYHIWVHNFSGSPGFDVSEATVTLTALGQQLAEFDVAESQGAELLDIWLVVNFTVDDDGLVTNVEEVQAITAGTSSTEF